MADDSRKLFHGAVILAIAGLISKVLSVGYRVPLQNITGDVGFYIYQQVYPMIGIISMLALYGFPVAISRYITLSTEEKKGGNDLFPIFLVLSFLSIPLFAFVYFESDVIAQWMGDSNLSLPIRVGSFSILLLPFTSIVRGYFQGMGDMKPTAYSQLIEQFVRVSFIIIVTYVLMKRGMELYVVGAGAALGSFFGGAAAIIFLLIAVRKKMKGKAFLFRKTKTSLFLLVKIILIYGIYSSLNHMVLLLFQFVDAFTVLPSLKVYGFNLEEARIWKGIYDRSYPLLQVGTVVGSSIGLALVPTVSAHFRHKEKEKLANQFSSTLKLGFIFGAGASGGLIFIMPYVNQMLFETTDGTNALQIMGLVILFQTLTLTMSSVLYGIGKMRGSAFLVLGSIPFKIILNMIFIPLIGIMGASLATVIVSFLLFVGHSILIFKELGRPKRKFPVFGIGVALLTMVSFLLFIQWTLPDVISRGQATLVAITLTLFGGALYYMMLVRLHCFTNEELNHLPRGLKGGKNK
ncbi:polysaccharide biosynthesis protein [Bacillaceae bacterium S4-13-56]